MTNGLPKDLYIPSDVQLGGQRTSASQLRTHATCEQEWFLSYLCPHPDVPKSAGLTTRTTADPLLTGSYFHGGMHAYLLSGWRDGGDSGERDIDKAIGHLEDLAHSRAGETESPEQAEENCLVAKQMLLKYDELRNEYTDMKVVGDSNGEAVLEREYQLPIGPNGEFTYTNKIDSMLQDREGYHYIGEFKTTSFRFANQSLNALHMQGQSYGHMGVLTRLFPTAPIGGIHFMVFVKDRGKKSNLPHVYERAIIIPGESVDAYFDHVLDRLYRMVDSTQRWQVLCNEGWEPYSAGIKAFMLDGVLNGQCTRFNRPCAFRGYCENFGLGSRALRGFRPKFVDGEVYTEPEDEKEPV